MQRFVRFLVVGVTSAAIDVGLLTGLHELLGVAIPVATTIGFWTALVVNFSLNRRWSFGSTRVGTPMVRYGVLVVVTYLFHLAMVTGGDAIGVPYAIAKLAAIALGAVGTFVAYDRWVFVK